MSDLSLKRAVQEALAGHPRVRASEIAVQVVDRDALLRGTVGSAVQQVGAVRTARGVAGIRHVEDLTGNGRSGEDRDAALAAAASAPGVAHVHDELRLGRPTC